MVTLLQRVFGHLRGPSIFGVTGNKGSVTFVTFSRFLPIYPIIVNVYGPIAS